MNNNIIDALKVTHCTELKLFIIQYTDAGDYANDQIRLLIEIL